MRRPPAATALLAVAALATLLTACSKDASAQVAATTSTPKLTLDAEHLAAAFVVEVEGKVSGSKKVRLKATADHRPGEPEILMVLTDADDPAEAAISHRGSNASWPPSDLEAPPPADGVLDLGTCRATCDQTARLTVQLMDPDDGRWSGTVDLEAVALDAGDDATLSASVRPEPWPPAGDFDRVVTRARTIGGQDMTGPDAKALVLRIRGPQASLEALRLSVVEDAPKGAAGPLAILPATAPPDGGPVTADPLVEAGSLRCDPGEGSCEHDVGFLPDWEAATPLDLTIVRTGPPVEGVTFELVEAVWMRVLLGSRTEAANTGIGVTYPPGETALAAVRHALDDDGDTGRDAYTVGEDTRLGLEATSPGESPITLDDQPALSWTASCPPDLDGACDVQYSVTASGPGRVELHTLLIPT